MATILDLENVSISEMSKEELINLLRDIRLSRRKPSRKATKKKAASAKSKPLNVDNLTPEQAMALLEQLEGKLDES